MEARQGLEPRSTAAGGMSRIGEGRNGGKKWPPCHFLPMGFLAKTHGPFLQTFDAPSMALLVLVGKKWQVSS